MYHSWMNKTVPFFSVFLFLLIGNNYAGIPGCTDPVALNYSPAATTNDGSCIYKEITVIPEMEIRLPDKLVETSGLIYWDHHIWTHNDNSDVNIYQIDTISGNIIQSLSLPGVVNTDWEEISQDSAYLYIGDFGNNSGGNREDLNIIRVNKNSLLKGTPLIEKIEFSWSDQIIGRKAFADTDYDCEAFIVTEDSIYLFTKQWISKKTSLYSLPKTPGVHVAKLKATYNVEGLVTGAVLVDSKKLIALCGYSTALEPFILLLYDFKDQNFFGANKRKIYIRAANHQIEGITTANGLRYYVSNEYLSLGPFINIPQKLQIIDLHSYLDNYFNSLTSDTNNLTMNDYIIYPNPADDYISLKSNSVNMRSDYHLLDLSGRVIRTGFFSGDEPDISVSGLTAGIYFLKICREKCRTYKVIKK